MKNSIKFLFLTFLLSCNPQEDSQLFTLKTSSEAFLKEKQPDNSGLHAKKNSDYSEKLIDLENNIRGEIKIQIDSLAGPDLKPTLLLRAYYSIEVLDKSALPFEYFLDGMFSLKFKNSIQHPTRAAFYEKKFEDSSSIFTEHIGTNLKNVDVSAVFDVQVQIRYKDEKLIWQKFILDKKRVYPHKLLKDYLLDHPDIAELLPVGYPN